MLSPLIRASGYVYGLMSSAQRPEGPVIDSARKEDGTVNPKTKTPGIRELADLTDGGAVIGGVYRLDYGTAVVLTDDARKDAAGGVPLGAFLLAAEGDGKDEEVILLRVSGTEPLPNEGELVQTRLAVVRDATSNGQTFDDVADTYTRGELEQSAFRCEVLGTFYPAETCEGLVFGSDIDSVVSGAKYRVILPTPQALSWIASYAEPLSGEDSDPQTVVLGKVRFASTKRRARLAGADSADVTVRISDFISRKTAVFGMTRTGKSNTIKTLVTAVRKYGVTHGESIGQLIFDPQGEYANPNTIDKTGLKYLGGAEVVRIYRFGAQKGDPQVQPLGMNFFDLDNRAAVTDFINSVVTEQYGNLVYAKNFCNISWEAPDPTDFPRIAEWDRACVGLYGLLGICGFDAPSFSDSSSGSTVSPIPLKFTWNKEEFDEFEELYPGLVQRSGKTYTLRTPHAAKMLTLHMKEKGSWDQSSGGDDRSFKFISEVLKYGSVKATIRGLTSYHSGEADYRVEDLIWDDMCAGRIAIVDLSVGSGDAPKAISEKIVTHLLNQASERFRANDDLVPFQIVVEEAHNLFERRGEAGPVSSNPWLRLAKEAAKYKIGLVYATQEVSSVDRRILSNTSNWVVAHLNSDKETSELSHYYDFKTWASSLQRCEDVGFVRMKTYSGKYIVPVQVAVFDHAMINEARRAAGLPDAVFGKDAS
jgi:hypothetical protein